MHRWKSFALATGLTMALVAVSLGRARAQSDASVIAPIVARMLAYERTLPARAGGAVDVLVVFDDRSGGSQQQANALTNAFRAMGRQTIQGMPLRVRSTGVTGNSIDVPAGVDVVVTCEGMSSAVLANLLRQATRQQVLLVALTRSGLDSHAAVAVVIESGRPRIVTKLSRVQAARLQLSSQFLRLAEVL